MAWDVQMLVYICRMFMVIWKFRIFESLDLRPVSSVEVIDKFLFLYMLVNTSL